MFKRIGILVLFAVCCLGLVVYLVGCGKVADDTTTTTTIATTTSTVASTTSTTTSTTSTSTSSSTTSTSTTTSTTTSTVLYQFTGIIDRNSTASAEVFVILSISTPPGPTNSITMAAGTYDGSGFYSFTLSTREAGFYYITAINTAGSGPQFLGGPGINQASDAGAGWSSKLTSTEVTAGNTPVNIGTKNMYQITGQP